MSKHNRTEVIKLLRQQMDVETDPLKKLEYAKQIAKLLPRPRQARRPRKPEVDPTRKNVSIIDRVTGSAVDDLSDGERIAHHLVVLIENQCRARGGWKGLTRADKDILLEAAKATLSERDRATLEAYAKGLSPEAA